MSDPGAFNDHARAAIYEAGGQRCIGCGRTDITAQHRRARGMGGTSDVSKGHPANGVPLCGDGVRGCHGWAERHPREAELLGWRLAPGTPALGAPFYTRHGWRAWVQDEEDRDPPVVNHGLSVPAVRRPYVATVYVDVDEDLDRREARELAVEQYQRDRRPVR